MLACTPKKALMLLPIYSNVNALLSGSFRPYHNMLSCSKMAPLFLPFFFFFFFFFLLFSSATAACNQCVLSKAAFFASNAGLSSGACGYGPLALNMYGGHLAAALPSIFRGGVGCGACYQIRCKNSAVCCTMGTTVVVTDLHADKSNTTSFVLSSRAFRALALPGKDQQVLGLGIVDIEYKRVPCVYKGQNLSLLVEQYSKFPYYLAVKILYQGGQTDIVAADVAPVGQTNWKPMKRNYGVTWDTNQTPAGPLQFRFTINSGSKPRYFITNQVLPKNWQPGAMYNSSVQISDIALDGCTPCKPWK